MDVLFLDTIGSRVNVAVERRGRRAVTGEMTSIGFAFLQR